MSKSIALTLSSLLVAGMLFAQVAAATPDCASQALSKDGN